MPKFPRFSPGQVFGLPGPNETLLLDKRAADLLNVAAAELKRLGRVSAAWPLRWEEGPGGRRFSCDLPPEIVVELSGSGNPYSFVEQVYDPATNTWSDKVGGRTGDNCFESKGKAGLSGKVVQIAYQPTANDWRFSYVGYKKLGQCPLSMEESYTLTDDFFGVAATITTTDGIDWNGCAVGSWPGGTFLMMPGQFEVIPSCSVALNYRMHYVTFINGPILQITYKLPDDYVVGDSLVPGASSCGSTPTPSYTLGVAEIGRNSWNCPPGFQASFGIATGALYRPSLHGPGKALRVA